jgi:anti-anti-sigma factor
MHTSLDIDVVRRDNGDAVVVVAGEIDLSNVDAFRQAVRDATGDSDGVGAILTIDLSAVEYLDSAAVNTLYAYADRIIKVIAHPLLSNIFTISGLSELVAIEVATTAG